jgi:environmental stress-induced protein Ves
VRHLTPSHYLTTPWKNGGGTTTQLLVAPEGTSVGDRFLYRMSVADVASDGPFSTFPGYARHLVVVSGEGMRLALPDGDVELRPFAPVAFSGDDAAYGVLASGAVRDVNLIVDRARATGSLVCLEVDAPLDLACDAGETCIVHVLAGALDVADVSDTLVLDAPRTLAPRGGPARLVVARVVLTPRA